MLLIDRALSEFVPVRKQEPPAGLRRQGVEFLVTKNFPYGAPVTATSTTTTLTTTFATLWKLGVREFMSRLYRCANEFRKLKITFCSETLANPMSSAVH